MRSVRPKVLHRLGGRALVARVLDTAARIGARHVVVVTGHGADEVEAAIGAEFAGMAPRFARQMPQLGTGHAVQQALPALTDDGITLILSGDVPLTETATLQALLALCDGRQLALLTLALPDPSGYGRVVRGHRVDVLRQRAVHEREHHAGRELLGLRGHVRGPGAAARGGAGPQAAPRFPELVLERRDPLLPDLRAAGADGGRGAGQARQEQDGERAFGDGGRMIVKMKRLTLLCLTSDRDMALDELRALGLVHVTDRRPPAGDHPR
jgi:CTP:molybdopterin cytidylyltransferase MocA